VATICRSHDKKHTRPAGTIAATAALAKGLDKEAAPSWKEAAYDLQLRHAIVSLVDGRFDAAAQAFEQAKQLLPSPSGRGAWGDGKTLPSPSGRGAWGDGKTPPSPSGRGAGGEGVGPAIPTPGPTRPGSDPQPLPPDPRPLPPHPSSLDRLIEASKQHAELIPHELTTRQEKSQTALALGMVYHLLGQYDRAQTFFHLPLFGVTRSPWPAHRSFAGYGLARAVVGGQGSGVGNQKRSGVSPIASPHSRADTARLQSLIPNPQSLCLASLKEYPGGAWRDQTIALLAKVIEDSAEAGFGKSATPPGPKAGGGKDAPKAGRSAGPASSQERDAKADKERLAKLLKAKAEALPYWQEIIGQYPKGPCCEQALYHAGVLRYDLAAAAPEGTSDEMAKDAEATLSRLSKQYPKGPYAGDAYVRQIDFALERTLDLKGATALVEQGLQWAAERGVKVATAPDGTLTAAAVAEAAKAFQEATAAVPLWGQTAERSGADLLADLYNLHLRAAILAYIQEKYDEVAPHLDAAGPARPTDGMEANFDLQKYGLHVLRVCSARKTPAWRVDAIEAAKTDAQKLALKLADTYLHSQRPEKAVAIYKRFLAGDPSLGPSDKAVESYCVMKLALAYSVQKVNYEASIECYKRFLKRDYAGFPWAPTAIMRLAVLEYNATQDPRRSILRYQYVLLKYPNHPEAERALYFLALDALQLRDKALAESTCREYLDRYSRNGWKNSGWRDHVQRLLTEEVPKLQDPGRRKQR